MKYIPKASRLKIALIPKKKKLLPLTKHDVSSNKCICVLNGWDTFVIQVVGIYIIFLKRKY